MEGVKADQRSATNAYESRFGTSEMERGYNTTGNALRVFQIASDFLRVSNKANGLTSFCRIFHRLSMCEQQEFRNSMLGKEFDRVLRSHFPKAPYLSNTE